MAAKDSALLPQELARKISPWIVNSAQMTGSVGKVFLTVVAVFSLYGPVGINPDHNGFLLFLGPWVCPAAVAILESAVLARRRVRIFRGSPFTVHHDVQNDPAVQRLVSLFTSDEARQHLWKETLKVASALFVILGIAAFYHRGSLEWTLPSPDNGFLGHPKLGEPGAWFWGGLFGCSIFTFLILVGDFHRWCLMTWAKRELAQDIEK